MESYKKGFARTLAETGALFFGKDLVLKDGRPTPYFVNMAMFKTGRLSLQIGSFYASMMVSHGLVEETDIILGPSYKGSAIALGAESSSWMTSPRQWAPNMICSNELRRKPKPKGRNIMWWESV
jgi:orotate phosphoribosyltransferase